MVRGKGGHEDRLPLPADVGEAIAAYLRRGRPVERPREVFLRARAPYAPIAAGTVASTVRRACRRAGVAEVGSHRLRHTTACEMVAAGVPLVRIGQVLRHRSLQSTAIYARVDLDQLRLLAQPWPAAEDGVGPMSATLQAHVDDYLRLRRALGFKLERHGRILPQLAAYLEAAGASTVTRELAVAWAMLPASAHPRHWAARLAIARGFAAYLQTIDPATEIPPAGVFAVRYRRPTPYLWSLRDIGRLLDASARAHTAFEGGELRGAVRAARRDGHAGRRSGRVGA